MIQGHQGSLPSRGAWIEIQNSAARPARDPGRSPHGERGLKLGQPKRPGRTLDSRSPHGERGLKSARRVLGVGGAAGRSPHGERGLKFLAYAARSFARSRSPHGERGLKFGRC